MRFIFYRLTFLVARGKFRMNSKRFVRHNNSAKLILKNSKRVKNSPPSNLALVHTADREPFSPKSRSRAAIQKRASACTGVYIAWAPRFSPERPPRRGRPFALCTVMSGASSRRAAARRGSVVTASLFLSLPMLCLCLSRSLSP